MATINKGFKNYKDAELSLKANFIISCITNNANFTNPVPSLAEVRVALDEFNVALVNAKAGGKDLTILKNKKRKALEGLLNNLGLWVQLQSNGDEIILSGSGFDMPKKRIPVGILPKPVNFTAKPAKARGSIKLNMKAINGAGNYLYQYTTAPVTENSVWMQQHQTRSSITITGLASGTQYAFKAVGIGANPTRVFSDIVTSYVL